MTATLAKQDGNELRAPRDHRAAIRGSRCMARGAGLWRHCKAWSLLVAGLSVLVVRASQGHAATDPVLQTPPPPEVVSGGPFPIRSLSPIHLLFWQFTPERAQSLPRGAWNVRFDVVEANILARDRSGNDFYLFDFELTRTNLALQYGLLERLAIGLDIPLLYTWTGFLDNFIKEFEDFTGFRRNIRFELPQNRFVYRLQKDGTVALQGGSGAMGIGDIAFSTKALLYEEGQWLPAIAGRLALKLPTGDHDRALGSGAVDVGLGVALEKTLGPVQLYLNTGLTIPAGNPFSGTGIESIPTLASFLTGEYRLTERFSLLVQLNGVTSPIRNSGLDIDNPSFEVLAGFSWGLPWYPVVWQAGLMQDINNTNRTADFALFTSWSIFFGHRRGTSP